MNTWDVVIGLEVHVRLATRTKLFCACPTTYGAPPNTQICEVCAGHPGALPVVNREAVRLAVRLAQALGSTIHPRSLFARKSYVYPDLPKGYQITQFDEPLATGGAVDIELPPSPALATTSDPPRATEPTLLTPRRRRVALTRLHIEEDAGKTLHLGARGGSGHVHEEDHRDLTQIDLNRAGVPLVEIVSEPVLRSPEEAAAYLRALRGIVRALGVSDGNLEEGSLRCDANVSLRPPGATTLGTRTELKNLNSYRFVKRALDAEIARQSAILDAGRGVAQETRRWDPRRKETRLLRSKEETADYRYLFEPDRPPLLLDATWIADATAEIPELPLERRDRLVAQHGPAGLTRALADALCREVEVAETFERLVARGVTPRTAATWTTTELLARLDDPRDALDAAVSPETTAELLRLLDTRQISRLQAKALWATLWADPALASAGVEHLARREGIFEVTDTSTSDQAPSPDRITRAIDALLAAHPDEVAAYGRGKTRLLGWFVGQALSILGPQTDAARLSQDLRDALEAATPTETERS